VEPIAVPSEVAGVNAVPVPSPTAMDRVEAGIRLNA